MKILKRTWLYAVMMLTTLSAAAQGPNSSGTYYSAADGLKGETLKTALCGIIYEHTQRTYANLWTDFYTTDVRDDGYVWDMYSNITNYTFGTDQGLSYSSEGDTYNREHSFPKSWFGGEVYPMYTDLMHIVPVDGYINGRRSNYPFGETEGETYSSENSFSKLGASTRSGYTDKVFEPNDEYKGDFARIYFYMVTAYEEKLESWADVDYPSEMLDFNTYPGFEDWALEMLLEWSKNDPVSTKEINRNAAVYSIQGNRNPFVDYPGLEIYVWGDSVNVAFSYDDYADPTGTTADSDDDDSGSTDGDDDSDSDGDDTDITDTATTTIFAKVTSADDLTTGDSYIVVYEDGAVAMGPSAGNYRTGVDVTITDDTIKTAVDGTDTPHSYTLGGSDGAYTLYDNADEVYLSLSSNGNYLQTSDTADETDALWVITIGSDTTKIVPYYNTARWLQYNSSTNALRFACYSSKQKQVTLYKAVGTTDTSDDDEEETATTGSKFVKIHSIDSVIVGKKYILVAESTSMGTVAMSAAETVNTSSQYRTAVAVSADADTIITETGTDTTPHVITLGGTSGAYTLYDAVEQVYLARTTTSASNYLQTSDDATATTSQWTITLSADTAKIYNAEYTAYGIWFYNSSSSARFSCYASTSNKPVYLYMLTSDDDDTDGEEDDTDDDNTATMTIFSKVTSSDDLEIDSEYLIVYESGNLALSDFSSTYFTGATVTIADDNTITTEVNGIALPHSLTLGGAADAYTLYDSVESAYLAKTSSGNNLTTATDATATTAQWTISIDDDGTTTITNNSYTSYQIQYNTNNPRFSCYTGKQNAVTLYKKTGTTSGTEDESSEVTAKTAFVRITTQSEVTPGSNYLVVYEGTTNGPAAMGASSGNIHTYALVSIEDDTIRTAIGSSETPHAFTLGGEADKYTFYDSTEGKYLALTANSNYLKTQTDASDSTALWSITILDDAAQITNVKYPARSIYYNSSSPRFACYVDSVTTMKAVVLYKQVAPTATMYLCGPAVATDGGTTVSDWDDSGTTCNAVALTYYSDGGYYYYSGGTIEMTAQKDFVFSSDLDFSAATYTEDAIEPISLYVGRSDTDDTYKESAYYDENGYALSSDDTGNGDTQWANFLAAASSTSQTFYGSNITPITFNLPTGTYDIRLYVDKNTGGAYLSYYVVKARSYRFYNPGATNNFDDNDTYKSFYDCHAVVLPNGVNAYYVSSTDEDSDGNTTAQLTKLTSTGYTDGDGNMVLPAYTPVILATATNNDSYVQWIEMEYYGDDINLSDAVASDNMLKGQLSSAIISAEPEEGTYNYIFGYHVSGDETAIGFYAPSSTLPCAVNSVYLQTTTPIDEAKGIRTTFGSDDSATTGITQTSDNPRTATNDAYYTLQGIIVEHPTAKGVYIHGNKKIVIK